MLFILMEMVNTVVYTLYCDHNQLDQGWASFSRERSDLGKLLKPRAAR